MTDPRHIDVISNGDYPVQVDIHTDGSVELWTPTRLPIKITYQELQAIVKAAGGAKQPQCEVCEVTLTNDTKVSALDAEHKWHRFCKDCRDSGAAIEYMENLAG